MTSMTRWSIAQDRVVSVGDRGADGYVTEAALSGWIDAAVDAYLAQCDHVHRVSAGNGLQLIRRLSRRPRTSLLGQPDEVLVTASATEIRSDEFVISVRLRPVGDQNDLPVNVTCRVSLEHPTTGQPSDLGSEIRDQLVELERQASYFS